MFFQIKKRLLYRGLSHLAFNWDFPSILFDISDRHNTYTQTLQISLTRRQNPKSEDRKPGK